MLAIRVQLLLKLLVEHLAEFSSDAGVFAMFLEQLKKTYFNILIKPERLGKCVRPAKLSSTRPRPPQTDPAKGGRWGASFAPPETFFVLVRRDVRLLILEQRRWSLGEKYQATVAGLSLQDLLAFVGRLKAELYVEGLVQGNFTSTVGGRLSRLSAGWLAGWRLTASAFLQQEAKDFLHYFTE